MPQQLSWQSTRLLTASQDCASGGRRSSPRRGRNTEQNERKAKLCDNVSDRSQVREPSRGDKKLNMPQQLSWQSTRLLTAVSQVRALFEAPSLGNENQTRRETLEKSRVSLFFLLYCTFLLTNEINTAILNANRTNVCVMFDFMGEFYEYL